VLLMYFPGGLVQIVYAGRNALVRLLGRGLPEVAPTERPAIPARPASSRRPVPPDAPVLRTDQVCVTFGGNHAVDHVDLEVRSGEIVGLIGANGAGKTTLMNAVGGFLPCTGQVWLEGRDVSGLAPARRAELGLGRAFQNAELFPDLTVHETVQLALERAHPSSTLGVLLGLPGARRREHEQQSLADELVAFFGLGRYARNDIGELSTGTRRITELACLLALDASVLCLDEPTAGVAQKETEAFGPLLHQIRSEFDLPMLIIEHDMPLVLGVSDRVYCLEAGRVIAEGLPADVRGDSAVVASYLGTDERTILRSGSL
jgi:ABC-type branched-subunit amino acid transport system ATPase component